MIPQKYTNKKVYIELNEEEKKYFTKIFDLLDYEKTGKRISKSAIHFIRDSGLKDNVIKEILILASLKDQNYIYKNEFFIILRLIALAQNNIPFNINSLQRNTPIPPLPIFIFLQKTNLLLKENIFQITGEIEKSYYNIFKEKKDTRMNYISKLRTILFWNEINPNNISINENVMKSLEPLKHTNYLNVKEFIVGCYLLYLSKIFKMPIKLPETILKYLGRDPNINIIIEIPAGLKKNTRISPDTKKINPNYIQKMFNTPTKPEIKHKSNKNIPTPKNIYTNLKNIDNNITYKEMEESGLEIDHTLKLLEDAKQKESISLSNSKTTDSHSNSTNSFITPSKIESSKYVTNDGIINYTYGNNSNNNLLGRNNNISPLSISQTTSKTDSKNQENVVRRIAFNQNIGDYY
jgi:hypothetical protein